VLLASIDEQERVRKGPLLRVPSLYPGESFSSGLDRAASFWGVTRRRLIEGLSREGRRHNDDIDAGQPSHLQAPYCSATGMSLGLLKQHLAARREMLLAPPFRYAYCPFCFSQDLASHVPFFRLDWARVFLTHCQVHQCPLFQWRDVGSGARKFPHAWYMGDVPGKWFGRIWFDQDLRTAEMYSRGEWPRTVSSRKTWEELIAFETKLLARKIGDPIESTASAEDRHAESLLQRKLVDLMQPLLGKVEQSILYRRRPDFEDHAILAFTLRTYRDWQPNPTWKALRKGLSHLACRRAALYVLANEIRDTNGAPLD
jgi:hypothetical protein